MQLLCCERNREKLISRSWWRNYGRQYLFQNGVRIGYDDGRAEIKWNHGWNFPFNRVYDTIMIWIEWIDIECPMKRVVHYNYCYFYYRRNQMEVKKWSKQHAYSISEKWLLTRTPFWSVIKDMKIVGKSLERPKMEFSPGKPFLSMVLLQKGELFVLVFLEIHVTIFHSGD